jgi:hypothetical protein
MSLLADLTRNCGIISTLIEINVSERGKKTTIAMANFTALNQSHRVKII